MAYLIVKALLTVDWLLLCVAPRFPIVMKQDVQLDSRETNNFRWDLLDMMLGGNENTRHRRFQLLNSEQAIDRNT